ncbi:hypothetical protein QNI16_09055 [Cytophagaceae bacterium YF14B1]|uniref:Uncharacterized protein n=1 Tax=Xanthocytophaga flava TaxID=3048013 RepID=A0AAE3U5U0_9BACT|nr:hypothetical protein [Xanthocytophaga flavus]MDJ1480631.1 hypothetical protein [Xanthocytophaga flavus]
MFRHTKFFFTGIAFALYACSISISAQTQSPLSLNGFSQWITGHDEKTEQLFPLNTQEGLAREKGKVVAHVKFNVKGYGEVSFPIDPKTLPGEEARKVDLSKSKFIRVTYQANQEVVLQLRQTGVHGGVQNHVVLPASKKPTTRTIYFSEFKGGKTTLDLSDVAKFNFAFLSNPPQESFAELRVKAFYIDQYQP